MEPTTMWRKISKRSLAILAALMTIFPALGAATNEVQRSDSLQAHRADTIFAIKTDTIYVQPKTPCIWKLFCPELFTLQYAGNIGMFSMGFGWDYGKHDRWETQTFVGFVPGVEGDIEGAPTITLRENLVPWQIPLGHAIAFTPAVFSFTINSIVSNEFWIHEPRKYNDGDYYRFSSKFRFMIGFGQRLDLMLPQNRYHRQKDRLSLYYELSTYDLAIISAIPNKSISLVDILALGIGVQYKFW